ncbi:Uncharacterised protein [Mycobacterium tuberculosis]|uniref:Uncharacterized protein n=1 Tax=Mycobacterium tuberculosis TaxID=1773 RepID=A0A916P756_MYCTX|nr:Uncharacterised protein [Mycobacterium tuberculosis]COX66549.1 Uncharacterised protein [Mycobacterium tuberculosis]
MTVSGDHTNAPATPNAMNGNTSRQMGVPGAISHKSHVIAIASTEKPKPSTHNGWDLSMIMPTNGASTPPTIAVGANSTAVWVGDNPHTACA